MFKKIPQDNVTRRLFTVHKENKLTQDDVDVYQVHDVAGSYDADTDPLVGASGSFPGYSVRGLYNSAKLRYYNPSGSILESFVGFTSRQTYAKEAPVTIRPHLPSVNSTPEQQITPPVEVPTPSPEPATIKTPSKSTNAGAVSVTPERKDPWNSIKSLDDYSQNRDQIRQSWLKQFKRG